MYLEHIAKDLGSIGFCDRNSFSGKLSCLTFELAFSNRSFWKSAQLTITIRYCVAEGHEDYIL